MSNNRFTWPGLEELKAQLRALPAELGVEAAHIIEGRANGAAATIKGGYPDRTGDLRQGVEVEHTRSPFGARSVVRNTSQHAGTFENGSEVRHTKIGANRGRMPPNHLFSREMTRGRRAAWVDLADMMQRKGLTVTGDA